MYFRTVIRESYREAFFLYPQPMYSSSGVPSRVLAPSASPIPLLIAGPGLLVPLCEELIYRQMCQQWLKAIIPGPAAVCAAALLFAACHGNMLQFIYALPMGLLLGALRESKAGLPGAVCFHAGANLAAIAAARLL